MPRLGVQLDEFWHVYSVGGPFSSLRWIEGEKAVLPERCFCYPNFHFLWPVGTLFSFLQHQLFNWGSHIPLFYFLNLVLYLYFFGGPWGADPREEAAGVWGAPTCCLGPPLGLQDPDTIPVGPGVCLCLCSLTETAPPTLFLSNLEGFEIIITTVTRITLLSLMWSASVGWQQSLVISDRKRSSKHLSGGGNCLARVCEGLPVVLGGLMSAALGWASVSELVTEIQTGLGEGPTCATWQWVNSGGWEEDPRLLGPEEGRGARWKVLSSLVLVPPS